MIQKHGMAGSSITSGERPAAPRGGSAAAVGTAPHRLEQSLKRAGAAASSGREGEPWPDLLRLISSEYPYCTLSDVNIADGNIISCRHIQRSLTFGPTEKKGGAAPVFDDYWTALKELCRKIETGSLMELRFSAGRPVSARRSEGGRRFRRLLATGNEAQ